MLWQPSRVMQFEKVSVSATLAAVDEGLSGVLAVFYDGDPERGGEAFDAGLIPHIRANDRYVARVRFQPRTCGAHTAYVVAQAAVASSSTVDVECPRRRLRRSRERRSSWGSPARSPRSRSAARSRPRTRWICGSPP